MHAHVYNWQRCALEVRWVPAGDMLADCLTKRGVNPDKVMEVFEEGRLPKKKKEME